MNVYESKSQKIQLSQLKGFKEEEGVLVYLYYNPQQKNKYISRELEEYDLSKKP